MPGQGRWTAGGPYLTFEIPPVKTRGGNACGPSIDAASAGCPSTGQGEAQQARTAAAHEPKRCQECNASIYWAQVLENGQRVFIRDSRTEQRREKAIPVDCEPTAAGSVVLFHRAGEGIVCRVLRRGEAPPAGAKLRTFHRCSQRASGVTELAR
jgi:hypothetical protein